MKKSYIVVIVLVVVLGIMLFVFKAKKSEAPEVNNYQSSTTVPEQNPVTTSTGTSAPLETTNPNALKNAPVKEFTVVGSNFAFTPNTMAVKKGDHVKITFQNKDGFHDFKIDEYKVATPRIKSGETSTVEFIADKAGSFEYYCSVGSHRAMGMKGTLTVE